jgi:glyoxylase-like metal-dependent hydrolase (beta-lactamase superfamily II)
MKRWQKILLAFFGILGAAYYWLLVDNRPGGDAAPLNIATLRQAAGSLPGEKPARVEVETISSSMVPETAMAAGTGWDNVPLSINAYRAGSVVIDTAFDKAAADSMGSENWDNAVYGRVQAALLAAKAIVVTHEHLDHIGGALASPHWAQISSKSLITREQFDHPEITEPVTWPKGSRESFKPHDYAGVKAIAPGVAVMKAPSHTPGSQIVFVQLADGREYLFTGDIASLERNRTEIRARSRLVGDWMVSEDRPAVFRWLTAFNQLARAEPTIIFVPTHDQHAVDRLVKEGRLVRGFGPQS